ncbi:hypothetical protein BJ165DRAFT_1456361 [Panaeolus papilionaceus]|nr:hypothetical protein BJ165DRAFT_1456361 [Panaeolus papilionaceus]
MTIRSTPCHIFIILLPLVLPHLSVMCSPCACSSASHLLLFYLATPDLHISWSTITRGHLLCLICFTQTSSTPCPPSCVCPSVVPAFDLLRLAGLVVVPDAASNERPSRRTRCPRVLPTCQ